MLFYTHDSTIILQHNQERVTRQYLFSLKLLNLYLCSLCLVKFKVYEMSTNMHMYILLKDYICLDMSH